MMTPESPAHEMARRYPWSMANPPACHPQTLRMESAKWLNEIIFLERDILGFWEVRGYSNTADRWSEDRFS